MEITLDYNQNISKKYFKFTIFSSTLNIWDAKEIN